MKKFYTFLFYFIFEYKFLISQNAIAGIFDIFKEPAEVCVDILKKKYDLSEPNGGRKCKGIFQDQLACMKISLKDNISPLSALKKCKLQTTN